MRHFIVQIYFFTNVFARDTAQFMESYCSWKYDDNWTFLLIACGLFKDKENESLCFFLIKCKWIYHFWGNSMYMYYIYTWIVSDHNMTKRFFATLKFHDFMLGTYCYSTRMLYQYHMMRLSISIIAAFLVGDVLGIVLVAVVSLLL